MGTAIFYPVFAQVTLAVILLCGLGLTRQKALKERAVKVADIALDDTPWPPYARQVANCYRNQFELPVIFYVLCLIAFAISKVDSLTLVLAWAFVVTRYIHAFIHTTSNVVMFRGGVFILGFLIIGIMLVWIAGRFIIASL